MNRRKRAVWIGYNPVAACLFGITLIIQRRPFSQLLPCVMKILRFLWDEFDIVFDPKPPLKWFWWVITFTGAGMVVAMLQKANLFPRTDSWWSLLVAGGAAILTLWLSRHPYRFRIMVISTVVMSLGLYVYVSFIAPPYVAVRLEQYLHGDY